MYYTWFPYDSFGLDVYTLVGLFGSLWGVKPVYRRFGETASVAWYWLVLMLLCLGQRYFFDTQTFGSILGMLRVLSWGLFVFGPLACWLGMREQSGPVGRRVVGGLGLLLAISGSDAFWIEPNMLDVTNYVVQSPKITEPKRIVLLADIQTDSINTQTRQALRMAKKQNPDLIVYAGDYLQHSFWREYQPNIAPFNALLKEFQLDIIPSVVVEGDAEVHWGNQWHALFENTRATILDPSDRMRWQGMEIVGLTMEDSKNGRVPPVSSEEIFSIIVGHNPNFSLTRPKADLYLAGHTHGGQVRLPFLGPLVTLSEIPTEQTAGRTELDNGSTLIVSRGIGMERYDAPRLRFLCHPEIVVIDLLPES